MGLALLANLSAYDFGYMSAGQLIERTANAFHTMEALERHRGHFYNWYDTQSLKPLLPTYISTVDSGNLAGHLLTLRSGLLALPDQKILRAAVFEGLATHSSALEDATGKPLRPSSLNSRRIWSLTPSPGPPRSRRRGSALTGWRDLPRRCAQLEGRPRGPSDVVGARTRPAMPGRPG